MPLRRDTLRLSEDEVFGHEPGAPEEPPTDPLPPIAPPQVEGMGSLPLPGLIFEPDEALGAEEQRRSFEPPITQEALGDEPWGGGAESPVPVVASPREYTQEDSGVDTAKAGRFSRYLSDTVDPRELKRQIRFKEQVVRSLRESSDREITLLENEIGDLQKALIARAKPPTLSPASGKPSSPSELKPGQKLRGLSLYDDYLDCIEISREAQAARLRQRSGVLDSGDARADEGRQYSMSVPGEREWWRDRSIVEKRAISYTRFAAYAGIFGVCCSLAQNELILHETEPHAPEIDALKMLNSAATLLCILCIYRNYWLCTLVYRINRHCRRMTPLNANITVMDVMSQPSFWIEAFVVAIHCPPFYTDEYSTYSFDNIVVYRAETLGALANTVRIYLLWRWYSDLVLYNVPKRHTIASFTGAKFGTVYVLKKSLHGWRASVFLLASWAVSLCFCAYWYRAAEVTACSLKTTKEPLCTEREAGTWELFGSRFEKHNDYYFWDSFWLMYITTLSIGYGDITPDTHYGRVAAAIVTILGILIGSLLTASMMTNMEWSDSELSLLHILERAKAQDDLKKLAISRLGRRLSEVISRRRKSKQASLRAGDFAAANAQVEVEYKTGFAGLKEVFWNGFAKWISGTSGLSEGEELTVKLRCLQDALAKDIVDIQPENVKFETIYARVKFLERAASSIYARLEQPEVFDSILDYRSRVKAEGRARAHLQHNTFEGMLLAREKKEGLHATGFTQSLLELKVDINGSSPGVTKENSSKKKTEAWNKMTMVRQQVKLARLNKHKSSSKLRQQLEKEKTIQALESLNDDRPWHRDKKLITARLYFIRIALAVIGTVGTCLTLVQNEMVIVGYGSLEMLNILKSMNSGCSLLCVLLLVYMYWIQVQLERVLLHVHQFRNVQASVLSLSTILKNPVFYIELLIVGAHCPPNLDYQYGSLIMGNFMVYRIETVFSCLNLLRIYLIWRVVAHWMLSDLPKRHTLAGFKRVNLGTAFILKRMLNSWASFIYITVMWCITVFMFGYWFRAAELTACQFPPMRNAEPLHPGCFTDEAHTWTLYGSSFEKINDYYLQNSCWLMFVTITTVGYGERTVTTHFGRLTASIAGLAGLLLVSLMTASLGQMMQWTDTEGAANRVIDRDRLRTRLQKLASNIICRWWRRMQKQREGYTMTQEDIEDAKFLDAADMERIRVTRSRLFANLDTIAGHAEKLNKIMKKTDRVEEIVELIAFELWSHDIDSLVGLHAEWEEGADQHKANHYRQVVSCNVWRAFVLMSCGAVTRYTAVRRYGNRCHALSRMRLGNIVRAGSFEPAQAISPSLSSAAQTMLPGDAIAVPLQSMQISLDSNPLSQRHACRVRAGGSVKSPKVKSPKTLSTTNEPWPGQTER